MARLGTILVVDDEAAIRRFLEQFLAAQGYTVTSAPNGQEALALTSQVRPDLVLVDGMMPGLDGLAVCRRLRDDEATRDLPIILITASAEADDIWLRSGANAVVRKPFDGNELLSWVARLIAAEVRLG